MCIVIIIYLFQFIQKPIESHKPTNLYNELTNHPLKNIKIFVFFKNKIKFFGNKLQINYQRSAKHEMH